MRKTYLLALIFLFSYSSILAQTNNPYSITAQVVDEKDSLIMGNILILNYQDTTLLTGAYFLEGNPLVEGITQSPVLVKLTSMGYADILLVVKNDEHTSRIDLGKVMMRTTDAYLGEITVTAHVPLFEPSPDGSTRVNVQNTMLVASGSVREILSKSPNVMVTDDVVSVFGKGEALLYLNGKMVPIERLESIPANQVKSIEIITNPSARYDAQGKAVINIITVVNHSEGISGAVMQNFTQAKHFLSSSALNLNYRKKRWSVSADYGISLGKDWVITTGNRIINTDLGVYTSDYALEEDSRYANVANYRFGVGYQINNKADVSVEYAGNYSRYDLDLVGSNKVVSPSNNRWDFKTLTTGDLITINNSVIGNFNLALDTLGSYLFIGGQYSDYSNAPNEFIEERIFLNDEAGNSAVRNNLGSNDIQIMTGQLDYMKTLKKGASLELGAKLAHTVNRGKIDFFTKAIEEEVYQKLPEFSNDFEYSEMITAFYAQLKGSLGKNVNYGVGARAEHTLAEGVSRIINQTVIDTSYFNIFPNASLNWKITKDWNAGILYSGRIERPKFLALDPFVWYQDSLTSRTGNPFLQPEITQAFEGVLGYKAYSLRFGYNHSLNHFRFAIYPGSAGANSVVIQPVNLQQMHSYFATTTIPIGVKFWDSYNTISVTLSKIKDDRPEFAVGSVNPQLYVYSYNGFKVKSLFKLELMGEYTGSKDDGIYQRKPTYSVSSGISRNFLNNSLECRFMVNDIFRSYRIANIYSVGQTVVDYEWRFSTHYYRLSLRYNFGKLKNTIYKNKKTGEEELRRTR